MKKIVATLVMLCSVLFMFGSGAYAADTNAALSLTMQVGNSMMSVNGTQKEIDPGRATTPIIIGGRTLVPIRAIVEEMGGAAVWDQDSQTTTLTYENDTIQLTMNSTTAYYNGEAYTLDAAPTTINERTMLPIRFIAESFRFTVDWNPAEQVITMTKNEGPRADEPALVPQPENPAETNEPRALVVYFSATGNTKALAEKVAQAAEADLEEIVPEVPYTSADLNYNDDGCRANVEIESNIRPNIQALSVDWAQYDVILLGYPIWWGQCPPAVLSFLEGADLSDKTIMPFCTSGSSGISGSLPEIRQICSESAVTDGFRGTAATTGADIEKWLTDNAFRAIETSR